jgi:hypothetical protein
MDVVEPVPHCVDPHEYNTEKNGEEDPACPGVGVHAVI